MSERLESCIHCCEPTGLAGRSEDSIYFGDVGPFCESCRDDIVSNVATARLAEAEARLKHADKLAYEVARAILNREHRERSAVSDSLLNYLNVGGIDGPKTVPEWMDKYRAEKGMT